MMDTEKKSSERDNFRNEVASVLTSVGIVVLAGVVAMLFVTILTLFLPAEIVFGVITPVCAVLAGLVGLRFGKSDAQKPR